MVHTTIGQGIPGLTYETQMSETPFQRDLAGRIQLSARSPYDDWIVYVPIEGRRDMSKNNVDNIERNNNVVFPRQFDSRAIGELRKDRYKL